MFENNPRRKKLVYKLSFVPLLLIICWWGVTEYIVRTGTDVPDESSGRVYSIPYKKGPLYLTRIEYVLTLGLPILIFLCVPIIVVVTSPAVGLFKFDDDD
jgi:hypothetical protein